MLSVASSRYKFPSLTFIHPVFMFDERRISKLPKNYIEPTFRCWYIRFIEIRS